ncbi:MAG: flagellar basal body-associated FliL family protein [Pseudomonadota bacterium]
MASEETPIEEEEASPPKKGGVLGMALPPVLAGAAAFGVSYFAPLPGMTGPTDITATHDEVDVDHQTMAGSDPQAEGNEDDKKGSVSASYDGKAASEQKSTETKPKALPTLIGEGGSDKKKKKKKGKDGDKDPALALLKIEPIVISLSQETGGPRRAPRLRIAIAVEALEDSLTDPAVISLKLRDGFTAAARALPPDQLGGPGGLEILREELLTAAKAMLGENAVSSILITDYLMT